MESLTALVLIGPPGAGELAEMVFTARLRAALDSITALAGVPGVERVVLAHNAEATFDFAGLANVPLVLDADPVDKAFHFGERLEGLINRYQVERVLYLGAGSMPLLSASMLAEALGGLPEGAGPTLVTNNLRSADWVAFNHASNIREIVPWLNRDNMLAWRLRENLGYKVISLPPSAATRLDIDTPFDLQVLALHPRTPANLREYLAGIWPRLNLGRIEEALAVLRRPGSRVMMIGRVPTAASDLLGARQLWTRVFSEERGMVAAHRQEDGQVFSFVADHIDRVGEAEFVAQLAATSDLVLFDTRVYMAHHQMWPPEEERFACDMGEAEKVRDARLGRLTEAVRAAPIPILMGGHNVVSGGVYALVEIADYQP